MQQQQQQTFHSPQLLTTATPPTMVGSQPQMRYQQQQLVNHQQQQQQQLMQRPQLRHSGNYSVLQQQRHMLPQQQSYRPLLVQQQPMPPRGPGPTTSVATVANQRPFATAPNATASGAAPLFQLPTFHGHVGAPLPSVADECLVGCVMLLLGYHSHGEAQRALWRRIIRSYGAEVLDAYDPHRITHVVVDWQLEDLDVFKQVHFPSPGVFCNCIYLIVLYR